MSSTLAPMARISPASRALAAGSVPSGGVSSHQRLRNSPAKPGTRPRMFGPGQRMARHEMHACGNMRPDRLDHRLLDRADIGDRRAGLQMRGDLGRDLAHGADRHGQNDQIGTLHRLGSMIDHAIHQPDLARGIAGGLTAA